MRYPLLLAALLGASLVPCVAATDGPPAGWFLAGDHPENYKTGTDGNGIAFLTSKADSSGLGFGTLMQQINAGEYQGMRVRFSATVRSENLTDRAGLWMRVDEGTKVVAFDNMYNRAIKGTTGWTTYEVVLEVPPNATTISFGTLVESRGGVWIQHAQLEEVGRDVPTTGRILPMKPVNLDFRQ